MARQPKKQAQSTAPRTQMSGTGSGATSNGEEPGDSRESMPAAGDAASAASQDAIALLKADHRKVEKIFEAFRSAGSAADKKRQAQQACRELTLHTLIEEEIFYPACRDAQVESEALDEAQVEHDGVKVLIAAIEEADPQSAFYDAKVTVLSENVKHHVREEEKADGIFAKAQQSGVDLKGLGEKIQARKRSLMELGTALAPPHLRSFDVRDITRRESAITTEESTMSRQYERPRDDQGRFEPEERAYRSRGSYGGRDRDDEDNRYSSSGRGWYGDPEGHSRASEEGWENRGGGRGGSSRDYRDEEGNGRRSQGGERGWYGDAEGHSRAAQEGWENRGGGSRRGGYSRSERDEDDDRRHSSSGRGGHGGWYGDSEGHSRAAEEGWENRGGGSRRSATRSERDEEDHRRSSQSGRSGHGGWYGDPEGHAEAARHRSRH